MIGAALAMLMGCSLAAYQPYLPGVGVSLSLLVLAVSCFVLSYARLSGACVQMLRIMSCLLCAYLYTTLFAADRLAARPHSLAVAGPQGLVCEAKLRSVSMPRTFEIGQSFDAEVSECPGLWATSEKTSVLRVRMRWYDAEQKALEPGSTLHAIVRLRKVHGQRNPGGFDFENYATREGIAGTGQILRVIAVQPVRENVGSNLLRWRYQFSEHIQQTLGATREAALLQALSVGDTRNLKHEDWTLMRKLGITHLIAISGLHITLLAVLGSLIAVGIGHLFPAIYLRIPRPIFAASLGLLLAGCYALLAGFEVPAQRTLIMLAAGLLGVLSQRFASVWQGYALALVGVLIFDPFAVLDIGAILSFAAVALLMIAFEFRLPTPGKLSLFLKTQALMSIGLLPLSLSFFGEASWVAIVVNLLAIPWISLLIVPITLAATFLYGIGSALLAKPLLIFAAWLWTLFLTLAEPLAQVKSIDLPSPAPWAVVIAMLGAVTLFAPRSWRWRYFAPVLFLPMLFPHEPARPKGGDARLTVFDAGQGLSILIQTHTQNWLYDTGLGFDEGASTAERTILPSLQALGVRSLDRLILSHGDADHAGGADDVLARFPSTIYTSDRERFPDSVACQAGQAWHIDGVRFRFLHPNEGLPYLRNDSSCVLHIQTQRGLSALLPGDIGEVIEARLLRTSSDLLPADVLIAPHHGSASSSTDAFLAAVQAKHVIFATGFANRFQFPRKETVLRVHAAGAMSWNLPDTGSVRIDLIGEHTQISAARFDLQQRRWYGL